jgi:flagellar biosynthesis protein FlhA
MAQATSTAAATAVAKPKLLAIPGSPIGWSEMAVPLAVVAIVVALIMPMPSMLLDFLIVVDITLSVIVLLVSVYIRKAVDFNVFPTTLLLLTMFRLALNISSARLILLNGNTGISAAGHVIEAFGSFVVGGNYIIGAVIFLVLIAIQYVVINHGAVRISEVTARFTLDALPGKQMSIDADLNGGLIDETEARKRRRQLSSEAEFFGAMDGASRFTQRDAIASILITGINIIAGFLIGVLQHGLVTVIPALMISIAGGLIVTRTASEDTLGAEFQRQVLGNAQPLMLASGVLMVLGLLPGLPTIPFLLLGGGVGVAAMRLRQKTDRDAAVLTAAEPKAKENLEGLLKLEPLSLDVGLGLVSLVEQGQQSPLLLRVGAIRRQLASQLGYLLPAVKVKDNVALRSREYVIQMRGMEIARYELMQGHELAISSGTADTGIAGKPARDPAFGLPALWVRQDQAAMARSAGYTVVDPVSIIGTHLTEIVRRHAHELFTRQDAKNYCDRVGQENPKLIEDLVPKLLSLATIQRVLQNLLRERVPIRDAVGILEAMGEAAQTTKNPVLLTEYVRQSIRRAVTQPLVNAQGELPAYLLDAALDRAVESTVEHSEWNSVASVPPETITDILTRVKRRVEKTESAAIVTSSGTRYFLRQLLEASLPNLTVLSHNEIPPEIKVRSRGVIE